MVVGVLKSLCLILVLGVLAAGIGCRSEQLTAEQVVAKTLEAQADVTIYRLDVESSVDTEGGEIEGTVFIDSGCVVDEVNEEMRINMSIDVDMLRGEETWKMERDGSIYLVDGHLYMKVSAPGVEGAWTNKEAPGDFWDTRPTMGADQYYYGIQTLIPEQVELLETAGVKLLEDEKVAGINCYVLDVTMDIDRLWRAVEQQLVWLFFETPPLPHMVGEVSLKHWVAKNTFFLTKVLVQMIAEESESTTKIVIDIVVYDHNKSVSIQLPSEALEAAQ